jgi:DnaJ-class molecular chaperone
MPVIHKTNLGDQKPCPTCHGDPNKVHSCTTCNGTGEVYNEDAAS